MIQSLTNKEAFDYLIEKMDKFGSPYFEESTVNKVLNESYLEWLNDKVKLVQANELLQDDLSVLTLRKSIDNPSKIVRLDFSPSLRNILSVSGTYTYECLGVSNNRERPISPINLDEFKKNQDNLDLSADDYFPNYIRYNNGSGVVIEIISKSAPSNVLIFYIKEPVLFDIEGKPDDRIEIGLSQQHEVIDLAIKKLQITDNNYQAAQAAVSEINSNG